MTLELNSERDKEREGVVRSFEDCIERDLARITPFAKPTTPSPTYRVNLQIQAALIKALPVLTPRTTTDPKAVSNGPYHDTSTKILLLFPWRLCSVPSLHSLRPSTLSGTHRHLRGFGGRGQGRWRG